MVAQGTAWAQSAFRNGWARGHPAGREALVDGLVEAFFDEVDDRLRATSEEIRPARDTESSDRPWRAELRGIARAFASVVHAHPEILSAVATRPLSVPVARRPGPLPDLRNQRRLRLCAPSGGVAQGQGPQLHGGARASTRRGRR